MRMTRIIQQNSMEADREKAVNGAGNTRHGYDLSRMFSSQRFLVVMLIIAIFDVLLAATELTSDILAIELERERVCDTDVVLSYFTSEHGGHLDTYFASHSVDEILEDLEDDLEGIRRTKREVRDVMEVSKRPTTTERLTTLPQRSPGSTSDLPTMMTSSAPREMHTTLLNVSHVFGYTSTAIITLIFIISVIKVAAQGRDFFRSKLQVLDALVICICLPIDICFLPIVWKMRYRTAVATAIPILFDVLSRSLRVVINSLMNLHAQDKLVLGKQADRLKSSEKKYRHFKRHVRRLRELAKDSGAAYEQIHACSKIVKSKRRKMKKTDLTTGIMSVNRLLFLGAPQIFPQPNQYILDESYCIEPPNTQEDGVNTLTPSITVRSQAMTKSKDEVKTNRSIYSSISSLSTSLESYESDDGLDDAMYDDDEHVMMESDMSETDDDDLDSLNNRKNNTLISQQSVITYM